MTPEERKTYPVATGFLDYFPDAIWEVAHLSYVANEQHNPGTPTHWDKAKSTDEADALMRHLLKRGTLDTDGIRHTAKVAWRAMALLQRELDAERAAESARSLAAGVPGLPGASEFVIGQTKSLSVPGVLPGANPVVRS